MNFSKLLVLLLLSAYSINAQDIPKEIENLYTVTPDERISDEFNGNRKNDGFDRKKWHYRESTKTGLGQGEKYVKEKNGTLICYGHKWERKAGAIVSNKYFQYGWYAFQWKTTGIYPDRKNTWHPSVWGCLDDTRGNKVPETYKAGDSWMEIDIMEFSTWSAKHTDWSSDAPAYIWVDSLQKKVKVNVAEGPKMGWKKAIMIDGKKDQYKNKVVGTYDFDKWQVLGMEYHPEYLQMWMKDGNQWVKVGHKIAFTDDDTPPTLRTVPKLAAKPLYWYLGNLFLPQGKAAVQEEQITNSTFEIDWFHFHPIK